MNKLFMILLAVVFCLSLPCSFVWAESEQDSQIYSLLLQNMNLDYQKNAKQFVIHESTSTDGTFDEPGFLSEYYRFVSRRIKSLDSYTWNNFLEINKTSVRLTSNIESALKLKLLSDHEYKQIFKDTKSGVSHNWDDFHKRFPGASGLIKFSRVGYNKSKTKALVYYSHSFAALDGNGYLILFEFKNNRWKFVKRVEFWVSRYADVALLNTMGVMF